MFKVISAAQMSLEYDNTIKWKIMYEDNSSIKYKVLKRISGRVQLIYEFSGCIL